MIKNNFIKKFQNIIPFISYQKINNESILTISKNCLIFNFYILKKQIFYQYNILSCISGLDLIEKKYRFCIVYDLLSVTFNTRLRIKLFIDAITTIFSINNIFRNSN